MDSELLHLRTGSHRATDLTERVASFVRGRGDGLVHLFVPHATAGLAVFEMGAGSEVDLDELLDRVSPATSATCTAMARRATAPTTSCPCSSRRR